MTQSLQMYSVGLRESPEHPGHPAQLAGLLSGLAEAGGSAGLAHLWGLNVFLKAFSRDIIISPDRD